MNQMNLNNKILPSISGILLCCLVGCNSSESNDSTNIESESSTPPVTESPEVPETPEVIPETPEVEPETPEVEPEEPAIEPDEPKDETQAPEIETATSGPSFIKYELSKDRVFESPLYSFTTEYDEFKEFDNIKGVFIDGVDHNGNPTKFFSWYGVPENLQEGQTAPAVVLVHGGGGTAFPGWVNEWTSRGYIAIAIAHEGQLPGGKVENGWYKTWEYSGPRRAGFFRDADNALEEQWFYHAVADSILANSFLRSLPEVDKDNIGINGISWGGVLTNVITGIDSRFKFSVPVYGSGFLYDSPKYSVDMGVNTEAELDFYYANWEPSLYIPLQELPVLYVNGSSDKQFALNIATPTYNLIPSEKYLRVELNMSHSTVAGYAPKEIYAFADYVTQEADVPITVTIDSTTDNTVVASHNGNVKRGILYYTTDAADWVQGTYEWQQQEIELVVDSNQLTVELPIGTEHYFINVLSIDNMMYSSAMESIIIPEEEVEEEIALDVDLIAAANMNYGIDTVATIYSDYQTTPDGLATFRLSVDITPQSGQAVISGVSGGLSTVNAWGVGDGTSETFDDLFTGDASEWVDSISNIQVLDFNANGSSLREVDLITRFKSISIVNAQSSNDSVWFKSGEVISEFGKSPSQLEAIDLETALGLKSITSFSVGVGNAEAKNKWSVEGITVKVTYN